MTNYEILKEYEAHKTPVPSYEEWRDLEDDLATCDKDLNNVCEQKEELYEENQQLKELLKQWLHFYPIVLYEHEDTLKTKDIVELYEKTTNAIGADNDKK